jgi:hypothetical protein
MKQNLKLEAITYFQVSTLEMEDASQEAVLEMIRQIHDNKMERNATITKYTDDAFISFRTAIEKIELRFRGNTDVMSLKDSLVKAQASLHEGYTEIWVNWIRKGSYRHQYSYLNTRFEPSRVVFLKFRKKCLESLEADLFR